MSAILELQLSQQPRMSWKGKTVQQIVSSIKKNTDTNEAFSSAMRARPTKHYRRELVVSATSNNANRRISLSVSNLTAPGTAVINSAVSTGSTCDGGIVLTEDMKLTQSHSERPCYPSVSATLNNDDTAGFSQAAMARRRVRSSGVISRAVRPGTTNDMYKTTNAEYLESRGLTFKQNQYNYVKEGSKTAIPGDVMSMNNIYCGYEISNYPKLLINTEKNNNWFQYEWIDSTINTITIPDGYYDAAAFTAAITAAMYANSHYYTSTTDGSVLYLIEMYYDSYKSRFNVTCKVTSSVIHDTYTSADDSTIPTTDTVPNVIIAATANFRKVVGIAAGTYPAVLVSAQNATYSADQKVYGYSPQIQPAYKPIYYKPNNREFAQQGAVSAGDRITRLRYNTITTAGSTFRTAFGAQTAAAYAYSVSATGTLNSLKQKMGYPVTQIPIIKPNGELCYTEKLAPRR
jgi:hypothetical protein